MATRIPGYLYDHTTNRYYKEPSPSGSSFSQHPRLSNGRRTPSVRAHGQRPHAGIVGASRGSGRRKRSRHEYNIDEGLRLSGIETSEVLKSEDRAERRMRLKKPDRIPIASPSVLLMYRYLAAQGASRGAKKALGFDQRFQYTSNPRRREQCSRAGCQIVALPNSEFAITWNQHERHLQFWHLCEPERGQQLISKCVCEKHILNDGPHRVCLYSCNAAAAIGLSSPLSFDPHCLAISHPLAVASDGRTLQLGQFTRQHLPFADDHRRRGNVNNTARLRSPQQPNLKEFGELQWIPLLDEGGPLMSARTVLENKLFGVQGLRFLNEKLLAVGGERGVAVFSTARLWDSEQESCCASYRSVKGGVCSARQLDLGSSAVMSSPPACSDTASPLLLCACRDGSTRVYDMREKGIASLMLCSESIFSKKEDLHSVIGSHYSRSFASATSQWLGEDWKNPQRRSSFKRPFRPGCIDAVSLGGSSPYVASVFASHPRLVVYDLRFPMAINKAVLSSTACSSSIASIQLPMAPSPYRFELSLHPSRLFLSIPNENHAILLCDVLSASAPVFTTNVSNHTTSYREHKRETIPSSAHILSIPIDRCTSNVLNAPFLPSFPYPLLVKERDSLKVLRC